MTELSEPVGPGPIEFLHEYVKRDTLGPSEYGGVPGLIQPQVVDGAEAHRLTPEEKLGVVVRAGSVPATGLRDASDLADAIDPVSKIAPVDSTRIA